MNLPHVTLKNAAVLAAAILLPWAMTNAAAATVRTQGPVQYLCGGVGANAMRHLRAQAHKFDLGFWMVKGPRSEYLADVPVTVEQNGKRLASFTAGGPLCYLNVPQGTYVITGRHDGASRTIEVQTGFMGRALRW